MSYEVTILDRNLKSICDVSMDRMPSREEADYLALCFHTITHGYPDVRNSSTLKSIAIREALAAFNTQYPSLHAKQV